MMHETTEIEAWTPEIISAQIREWRGDRRPGPPLSAEAMKVMIGLLELGSEDRATIITALPAFMCRECGKPSCLHGYPDD